MSQNLLEATDVRIHYHSVGGAYKVVDGVDVTIKRNEIFGIAGESGCGKSTLVEGIMRLIRPPGKIVSGQALFYPQDPPAKAMTTRTINGTASHRVAANGTSGDAIDLFQVEGEDLRYLRWRYISYIPQGSMNSLNPVMRIGDQMIDVTVQHSELTKREARERVVEVLRVVGLPERVVRAYPHELSGGMKQRVIIAMAVTLNPQLIVADEPTTALDVNVQRAVLETITEIKARTGATVIFVSHDMAVHAELVDRLAIMYAGEVVEVGTVYEIFESPKHPYSQRLIASIPQLGGQRSRLESITGIAPSPIAWPQGCRFHPRCPFAMEICQRVTPPSYEFAPGHHAACHLYGEAQSSQLHSEAAS
ncbi:MAG: ABC transporter ATP-binding protein [Caldilineaceae bacterium]|nr:ABC transporter ATP-binding protein [Caldilineaceae bacterium]